MSTQRVNPPVSALAVLGICAVTAGCAGGGSQETRSNPVSDSLPTTVVEARLAIDEAIGEARAGDVSECALIGIGQRPCGGPRLYRAYAVPETDSTYLALLVDVYDRLDRERNVQGGAVGTCEVLQRPALALENGRCVTVP